MKARDIPNLICVLRILLVPPIVLLLLQGKYAPGLLLFLIAGASDGLDGYLARRFDWRTPLGAILDPLADKLLMVCSYATLGWNGLLPLWLVVLVLGRDVIIIAGALVYHRLCGGVEMEPTRISKANTLFQILLVLLVMATAAGMPAPGWSVQAMVVIVAWTTLLSGGHYVWEWSGRARQHHRQGGDGA